MKKIAKELKQGEKIVLADQICEIVSIEVSDIGKQGKRKVRLEVLTPAKEKLILVRPEDYVMDTA